MGLYYSYRAICFAKSNSAEALQPTHPWYGGYSLSPDRLITDARKIFEDQVAFPEGTKVAGFKEIRWTSADLGDATLDGYMRFLTLVLGELKFIFLTRNIQEIYDSQKRAGFDLSNMDLDRFSEISSDFYRSIRAVELPIYEIDYSEITQISEKMISMYKFLDLEFDQERVASILSTDHSYANARSYGANP